MSPKKDESSEKKVLKEMGALLEPWIQAGQNWSAESEKLGQAALQGMERALDNSHRVARESLGMMATLSDNWSRQLNAQLERGRELLPPCPG